MLELGHDIFFRAGVSNQVLPQNLFLFQNFHSVVLSRLCLHLLQLLNILIRNLNHLILEIGYGVLEVRTKSYNVTLIVVNVVIWWLLWLIVQSTFFSSCCLRPSLTYFVHITQIWNFLLLVIIVVAIDVGLDNRREIIVYGTIFRTKILTLNNFWFRAIDLLP